MKLLHFVKLTIWAIFLLIYSSQGFAITRVYFDSISFKVTGSSTGTYRFFIYENNIKFYVTYFTTDCMGLPMLYKYFGESSELIFPDDNESAFLNDEQGFSFSATYNSLDAGAYFISLYTNPEVCFAGEVTFVGNTGGKFDINPCEHLFLYPSQKQKLTHSPSENEFLVIAPPNCPWVALKQNDWITISPNTLDWGPGIVHYSVSENQIQKPRNGSIRVYNEVFQIDQASMPPPIAQPPYLPYIPLLLESE